MSKRKGYRDVEARLRQQVLSGWSDYGQPEGYSVGNEKAEPKPKTPTGFWEQKCYIAFIPVIIKQDGSDSNGNRYAVQIATNVDIPLHTYSERSKVISKQAVSIPGTQGKASHKVPVVYGIQQDGSDTLSHPAGYTTVQAVANIYSGFLGKVATAFKCMLLNSQGEKESAENSGQREESARTSKGLGEPKTPGRGRKVRAKIRNEALPEEPAKLDETNGKVLGDRQANGED